MKRRLPPSASVAFDFVDDADDTLVFEAGHDIPPDGDFGCLFEVLDQKMTHVQRSVQPRDLSQ
jgi:hypothetical protein